MRASRTLRWRLAGALALIAAIVALQLLPVPEWLDGLEAWARQNPVAGAVGYLGLSVVAIVALTPGWIPMTLAGLMFGLVQGFAYALVAVVGGATAAFLVGRTLARGWVERRIAENRQLRALDGALGERAFVLVMLTRMAIVIPFNVLNYAYGLTRVGPGTYAAATATGMLPIVGLYVYLGTLAQDMDQVFSGSASSGTGSRWIAGVAVAAIALLLVFVHRTVRRALDAAGEASEEGARRVS